jgi:hypothetical protein
MVRESVSQVDPTNRQPCRGQVACRACYPPLTCSSSSGNSSKRAAHAHGPDYARFCSKQAEDGFNRDQVAAARPPRLSPGTNCQPRTARTAFSSSQGRSRALPARLVRSRPPTSTRMVTVPAVLPCELRRNTPDRDKPCEVTCVATRA